MVCACACSTNAAGNRHEFIPLCVLWDAMLLLGAAQVTERMWVYDMRSALPNLKSFPLGGDAEGCPLSGLQLIDVAPLDALLIQEPNP